MKVFQFNSLAAAIFLMILVMGIVGIFVVMPVSVIAWSWNVFSDVSHLPEINFWQASLLYLALGTILYLSGFLQIEIEAKKLD